MKMWKFCAYFNGTRENQHIPMASNGRLVIYVLLSILVVVNAGIWHDGEKMAIATSIPEAPKILDTKKKGFSFKAIDSSPMYIKLQFSFLFYIKNSLK